MYAAWRGSTPRSSRSFSSTPGGSEARPPRHKEHQEETLGVLGVLVVNSACMRHLLLGLLCLANVATAQCPGDCNADSEVTIDELVAAGDAGLTGCPAEGATAGMVRTCGPGGIITEPEVFIPSPSEA